MPALKHGEPVRRLEGSIHLAHTAEERIPKKELLAAVGIYAQLVQRILAGVV